VLDMKIRSASHGAKSLDDVLRVFYEKFATTGYEPQDFRNLCNEAAGEDLTEWFRIAVDSTEELDYQTAADWLGLKIGDFRPANFVEEEQKSPTDDAKAAAEKEKNKSAAKAEPKVTRWIGIGKPNSPATKAGIADTDEILAINRKRTSSVDTDIQKFDVGDPIEILIARNGELQEVLVVVGSKPAVPDWSVAVIKNPSDAQKAQLAAWLNRPLEEKKSETPPPQTTTDQPK
jgi:predicted metalloprotease with PDZ domain